MTTIRAIFIWEAIQKRSNEPIYKTHTKIEAKRLTATTFAIAKLEQLSSDHQQQKKKLKCWIFQDVFFLHVITQENVINTFYT